MSAEKDWQSGGTGTTDKAHGGVIPLRISNVPNRHLKLRYLTRWKNREHASTFKPGQGLANRFAVGLNRAIRLERIDEDAIALQLRNVGEEEIGKNLDVGTSAGQKNREEGAIEDTVGMVSDNHDRAARWDSRLIRRAGLQLNPHLSEKAFETETLWRALNSPVKIPDFANRCQLPRYAGKVRDAGQYFLRLTGVQML
jgi:hypothetical protein